MFVLKEILHNYLMSFNAVRNYAMKFHVTGLDGENQDQLQKVFDFYFKDRSISGKHILELGPGKNLEILKKALASGAKSCTAIDVRQYFDKEDAASFGIDYIVYPGTEMPLPDESFDFICSHDVLEHVRNPEEIVKESFRTLSETGLFIAKIDLRDHFYLTNKSKWFECLVYYERTWNMMTSNRSNYVNRLRAGEWISLLENTGFRIESVFRWQDFSLLSLKDALKLTEISDEDISTYMLDIVCKRP